MQASNEFNNSHDITGVLLYSETNFFQLIEGEEKEIKDLYSRIEKDPRHRNIIKFVDKPVIRPAFDGFISKIITDATNDSDLKKYLRHTEVLEPKARKAVNKVIESISGF
ncbi:BLUF domain-containing protein [Salegentibacter flavus]|uniref:BLUF domain-containing protein n=1 Tax=Salegentibacter flavus TaxID=287099 RepID=UPI000B862B82